MEAKELRIGNLTRDKLNKTTYEITANALLYLKSCEDEGKELSIEPIPLTDEWLINFGFTQDGDEYSKDNFIVRLNRRDLVIEGFEYDYNGIVISTEYFYVHDLQNLYFAIKRHELECN